jgi:hypothetical protein
VGCIPTLLFLDCSPNVGIVAFDNKIIVVWDYIFAASYLLWFLDMCVQHMHFAKKQYYVAKKQHTNYYVETKKRHTKAYVE